MATLLELKSLFSDSDLQDKVQAALIIAVQDILDGTPTADQQKYAAHVFSNPKSEAAKALVSVIAANNTASASQISGATDSALKSNTVDVVTTLTVSYIAGLV